MFGAGLCLFFFLLLFLLLFVSLSSLLLLLYIYDFFFALLLFIRLAIAGGGECGGRWLWALATTDMATLATARASNVALADNVIHLICYRGIIKSVR